MRNTRYVFTMVCPMSTVPVNICLASLQCQPCPAFFVQGLTPVAAPPSQGPLPCQLHDCKLPAHGSLVAFPLF